MFAGGGAADDPEGEVVLTAMRQAVEGHPGFIFYCRRRMRTAPHLNALRRAADMVVQQSLREGLGLTATEALWKGKPVIGGDVGHPLARD